MTTLALRYEELNTDHTQPLPEDICGEIIKKPSTEVSKIRDTIHRHQCLSETFVWILPQETIVKMGWIETAERDLDQIANEIDR